MKKTEISFKNYFLFSTWSVVMTSVMLAMKSDALTTKMVSIFPILLLFSIYLSFFKKKSNLNKIFSFLCWVGALWTFIRIIVTRDISLVCDLSIYLIFSNINLMGRKNSFLTIAVSSFVLCFGSIIISPEIVTYFIFLFYLFLVSFSLNAANFYLNLQYKSEEKLTLNSIYFFNFIRLYPLGFLIAFGVFFLFPRIHQINIELPFQVKQRHKVGYSGSVDLSDQGELQEDKSLVLTISSGQNDWLRQNSENLYLKGGSLDTFDGVRWSKTIGNKKIYNLNSPLYENKQFDDHEIVNLDIITNHLRNNSIFLPIGSKMMYKISKSVPRMYYDLSQGELTRDNDNPLRFSYGVKVTHNKPSINLSISKIHELAKVEFSKDPNFKNYDAFRKYTHIPDNIGKNILFIQWIEEIGVSSNLSLLENIKKIKIFFNTKYQSSLINSFSGDNSLLSFMSTQRRGHCEFFSTAAVLALRVLGIPARIATGYRGGQYNLVAEAVMVKQSHAHAWVEYFIPEQGWSLFEPTPYVSGQFLAKSSTSIETYLNAANYLFNKYLVDYNFQTQMDLINHLRKSKYDQANYNKSSPNFSKFIYIVILLIITFGYWWFRLSRNNKIPKYVKKFLLFIRKKGSKLERNSFESYRSFCKRLSDEGVVNDSTIKKFLELVEDDLYGPAMENIEGRIDEFQEQIKLFKSIRFLP